MAKKFINLNNYVCGSGAWYVSTQNIWNDMKDQNPRLRRWLNPPPIEPLVYFFKIDAGAKGWTWDNRLLNCYGFLITYYSNPDLIILTGNEPGGTVEMQNTTPQPETPGMIPVDWNLPFLANLDQTFTKFLESIGLSVPTWAAYLLIGSLVYYKIK